MFEKIGGRKFLGMILLISAGIVIDIYAPKGLSDNMLYLMMAMGGIYMGVNVFSKGIDKMNKQTRKTKEIAEIRELKSGMEVLYSQQAQILESSNVNAQALSALLNKQNGVVNNGQPSPNREVPTY